MRGLGEVGSGLGRFGDPLKPQPFHINLLDFVVSLIFVESHFCVLCGSAFKSKYVVFKFKYPIPSFCFL